MKNLILWGSITSLLAACGPSAEEKSKAMQLQADARFEAAMSDSVMLDAPAYFISEHHIRGKTKDVKLLVQEMEAYTRSKMGYVEQSEVNSEVLETKDLRLSKDAMSTLTRFRKVAELKLRVPYFLLDSAKLKTLNYISFIENSGCSNVNAEVDMIAGNAQQGMYENEVMKAEKTHGSNKSATVTLQQMANEKEYKENAQQLKRNNLQLQEAVMFATLNISVIGEEETYLEKQLMMAELQPYEPGFFEKMFHQFIAGFEGLKSFILWLVGLWVPLLFIALGVWQWKKWKRLFAPVL